MKIKFDVTPKELIIIKNILENYLHPNCKAWVFGSRAKSSALFNSDLDLALECKDKIDLKILSKIKIAFEDSRLPYRVDVVDINAVKPYFKEIIEKEMILFPFKFKGNAPQLRFKEFCEEWEKKNYSDIYTFYSTNSLSRDKLNYENGEVYNIHYGDIHTKFSTMFKLENELIPYVNMDIDLSKIKNDNYCQIGDLVIADASEDYNDIGKTIEIISLNNKKTIAGLHTFLARPNKHKIALGYMGYMLQSYSIRKQVMTIAQGTKVLSLSTGRLSNIELNLPQKQEQQKIASFLTSVDTKIEQLSTKVELLEAYKKGIMQKIFSQEIRFHPKGISSQVQGKDDDGSEFGNWEVKKLKEICTFFSGGTPTSTNKSYYVGNIPFIGSGKINSEIVEQFITKEALDNSSSKMVNIGDLLYALYGATSGQVAISKINGAINQAVLCIRSNENISFLYYFFKLKQEKILLTYLQGGQGNLSAHIIKSLKINLPQIKEQTKIANFLSSIDKKIELISNQSAKTKEFKKGLLQKMFV